MPRPRGGVLVLLALAALAVGAPVAWYLGSPVFLRTELHEPPIGDAVPSASWSSAVAAPSPGPTPSLTPATPAAAASAAATPAPTPIPTPTAWAPAVPRSGAFVGTDDFHFGRGTATLREVAPGEWSIRFEDFSVRNGPDLYVYLSPDPAGYADDAIEVARLKATDGSFNTRVPPGTDVSGVRSVLIWCKQFTHLFAVAKLDG